MKKPRYDPGRLIHRLLLVGAVLLIGTITLLHFYFFRPYDEALKLLLPSILAGLITALVIFAFRRTILSGTDRYLDQDQIKDLANVVAEELHGASTEGVKFYDRWHDVPWSALLSKAKELEFVASYMDTWLIQAAEPLQHLLKRGGTIRAFLPKVGSSSAERVRERFPEYSQEMVDEKIKSTTGRLRIMAERTGNRRAKVEIYATTTFCMHCLVHIDRRLLVLSPFDHFRRAMIESPAIQIDLRKRTVLADWASKEFDGFECNSEKVMPLIRPTIAGVEAAAAKAEGIAAANPIM